MVSRARRLVLMYRLRMAGVLETLTLRQIGQVLGVTRATVLQDLRELDEAEAEFQVLMAAEPWKEWVSSASQSGGIDDELAESLKRLLRDGLVWLRYWAEPKDVEQ